MAFAMRRYGGLTQANPMEKAITSAKANAAARAAAPRSTLPPGAYNFDTLEPGMCRWPIGDPSLDLTFCGAPRLGRSPYCGVHRKASHAPPAVTARVDELLEVPSVWKDRP